MSITMSPCHRALAVLFAALLQVSLIHGSAWISTEFKAYRNDDGRLYSGACCDPTGSGSSACRDPCDYTFTYCIGDDSEDESCNGDHSVSFQSPAENSPTFETGIINGFQPNPQGFKVNSWEGTIPIKMLVEHRTTTGGTKVVDVLVMEVTMDAQSSRADAEGNYEDFTLTGTRPTSVSEGPSESNTRTELDVAVVVYCDSNFYSEACDVYCVSSDSCGGHFDCDPDSGEKICRDGWSGDSCMDRDAEECYWDGAVDGQIPEDAHLGSWGGAYTCGIFQIGVVAIVYEDGEDLKANVTILDVFADPVEEVEILEATFTMTDDIWTITGRDDNDNSLLLAGEYDIDSELWTGTKGLDTFTTNDCETAAFSIRNVMGPDTGATESSVQELYCLNGGTCVEYDELRSCCCPEGFGGDRCDDVTDACATDPCENDGECTSISATEFECDCDVGFYGTTCSIVANNVTCAEEPCKNQGTCMDAPDTDIGYNCTCMEYFEGDRCEIELEIPCPFGYYGDDCDVYCVDQDECDGHHNCTDEGEKICLDGWIGDDCTEKENYALTDRDPECRFGLNAVQTCSGRGPCFQGTCCCFDGARYNHQDQCNDINECESNPCANGGTCINQNAAFECECTEDYFGIQCEQTNLTTIAPTQAPETTAPPTTEEPCVPADDCTGHYDCNDDNEKDCHDGWSGDDCNTKDIARDAADPDCLAGLSAVDTCHGIGYCWEQSCCCDDPQEYNNDDQCNFIDHCDTYDCGDGATCIDGISGVTCVCPDGTSGDSACPETTVEPPTESTDESTMADTTVVTEMSTYEDSTVVTELTTMDMSTDVSTEEPSTEMGSTEQGSTEMSTELPSTEMPSTEMPSTEMPSTEMPSTEIGSTGAETMMSSEMFTTELPTTMEPTTEEPCVDTDDCTGHYICHENGTKICNDGYSGVDCNTKDHDPTTNDLDCKYNQSPNSECSRRGYCFQDACCCDDPDQFDGSDQCSDINECDSNPCQNGGTCINNAAHFVCDCSEGTTGVMCEVEFPECTPHNDCEGHYNCTDEGIKICLDGWINPDNDCRDPEGGINAEPCIGARTCNHQGVCFEGACCCLDGYEGDTCEEVIDECASDPCQNGGECRDLHLEYICECPDGSTGESCGEETSGVPFTGSTEAITEGPTVEMTTGQPTTSGAVTSEEPMTSGAVTSGEPMTSGAVISVEPVTSNTVASDEPATREILTSEAPVPTADITTCPPGTTGDDCADVTTGAAATVTEGPTVDMSSVGDMTTMAVTDAADATTAGADATTDAADATTAGVDATTDAVDATTAGVDATTAGDDVTTAGDDDATAEVTTIAPVMTTMSLAEELATLIIDGLFPDGITDEEAEQTLAEIIQILQEQGGLGRRRRKRSVECATVIVSVRVRVSTIVDPDTGDLRQSLTFSADQDFIDSLPAGTDLSELAISCFEAAIAGLNLTIEVQDGTDTLLTDEKQYVLRLFGIHSDSADLLVIKAGIKTLYTTTYAALDDDVEVLIPRVEELIGEFGEEATLIRFWLRQADGTVVNHESFPELPSLDTIEQINAESSDMTLFEFNATVFFDYQSTHYLLIEGQAYEEDLDSFRASLTQFFIDDGKEYTVNIVPRIETFFLAETGALVSKIMYELLNAAGKVVLPERVDFTAPSETLLESYINFTSAVGGAYTLETTARATLTISHKTSSSTTLLRRSECATLVVEGSFIQASKVDFEAALTGGVQVSGTDVEVIIAGSEEVIIEGKAYTSVYYAYKATADSTILNARAYTSAASSAEEVVDIVANADISRPDGSSYSFTSNVTAIATATRTTDCLVFYAQGGVTVQQMANLTVSLTASVRQARPDLVAQFGDSLQVEVLMGSEVVAAGVGSSTGVYYKLTASSTSTQTQITISAQTQAELTVSTEILTENLVTEEGSAMFNLISIENTTVVRRENLMTFAVTTSVLPGDYAVMNTHVASFVTQQYGSEVTVETMVQEVVRTSTGSSLFQLGFSMTTTTGVAISTQTFSAVTAAQLTDIQTQVSAEVEATYIIETREEVLADITREDTLFKAVFTTPVSASQTAELQVAILDSWKQAEAGLFVGGEDDASVSITAVIEKVTETGASIFEVQYSLTVASTQVNAMSYTAVSAEVLATNVATVTNKQGIAYEINKEITASLSSSSSVSVSTTSLTTTENSWSIVMDQTVQTAHMESFTSVTATYVNTLVTSSSSLEVSVVRQREIITQTGEVQISVDLAVTQEGQVVQQTVVNDISAIETTELTTRLAAEITEVSYTVASVSVESTVSFSAAYSHTFTSRVTEQHTDEVIAIIQQGYVQQGMTDVRLVFVSTEETINIETSTTLFAVNYLVVENDVVLDARVDSVVSAEVVTQAVATQELRGSAGLYVALEVTRESTSETAITASSLVRASECVTITVAGEVAKTDMATFATVVQNTVTTQMTNVGVDVDISVQAVQTQTLLSLETSGSVSTSVLVVAQSGSVVMTQAMIGEIDATILQTQLSAQTFLNDVQFTAITSTTELATFVRAEDTVQMTFDVAVTQQTIAELETSITATLNARAEVSDVIVSIVDVQENLVVGASLEAKSTFTASIAIQSATSTEVISATTLAAFTAVELEAALDVAISQDTDVTFHQHLAVTADASVDVAVDVDIDAMVSVEATHSITLTSAVSVMQKAELEASIALSIEAEVDFDVDVEIAAIIPSFDVATGEEVFEVVFTVESTESTELLTAVDIKAEAVVAANIVATMTSEGVVAASGEAFVAVDTDAVVTVQREALFGCRHSEIVQASDVDEVTLAVDTAFKATMGFDAEADVQVTFIGNREVITEFGTSVFEAEFAIKVDGKLVDSRLTGAISSSELMAQLAMVTVTGSQLTYNETVVASTEVTVGLAAVAELEYNALTAIHTEAVVDLEVKAELEATIAAEVKVQMGLEASADVEVSIVKSETVITAEGEAVTRNMLAITVDGVAVDARAVAEIDVAAVATAVAADVDIAAEVDIRADVSVENTLRLEQAVEFHLENEMITDVDAAAVAVVMEAEFAAELGVDVSQVEVKVAAVETFFSSEGIEATIAKTDATMGTTLAVFVEVDGELVQQALSAERMAALEARLAVEVTLESGQEIAFTQQTAGVTFISAESTFGFFMSVKLQEFEIVQIEEALALQWTEYNGVVVKIFNQEVFFTATGERVFRVAFSGSVSNNILSSTLSLALTHEQIVAAFTSLTLSVEYQNFVLDIDSTTLTRKADLGFVLFTRGVLVESYADISTIIQTSWNVQFSQQVTITIVAQEEVIVKIGAAYTTATALYYSIVDVNSEVMVAQNFHAEFTAALSTSISATLITDIQYTTMSAIGVEIVSKTSLFVIYLETPILAADLVNVQTALATVVSVTATSTIQVQQEVFLLQADSSVVSRWQVLFAVTEGMAVIDAEQQTNIFTDASITTALATVTISGTAESYESVFVSMAVIQTVTVIELQQAFSVIMTAELNVEATATFETQLLAVWTSVEVTSIKVVTTREVLLSTGVFAFEMRYIAVTATGIVSATTNAVAVTTDQVTTILEDVTTQRVTTITITTETVRVVSNSINIVVASLVSESHNALFVSAVQAVYTEYTVVFGSQDLYIANGEFATELKFFLEVDTVEVNLHTITLATVDQLITSINTVFESVMEVTVITDTSTLVRMSSTFTFTLTVPVMTIHVENLQTNLLTAWVDGGVTEATAVTIVLQDEAVTVEGTMVFNIAYTVTSSSATSLITSTTYTSLTTAQLQSALTIVDTVYAQSMVAADVQVISLTALFTVNMKQKLAVAQTNEFETQLVALWTQETDVEVSELNILSQQQFVSITGEISWAVYYSVETTTAMLMSKDFESFSVTTLADNIQLTNVLGVAYEFVELTELTFSYEAGYSIYLSQPVLSVDMSSWKAALVTEWTTFTGDASIAINIVITEELMDAQGTSVFEVKYFVQTETAVLDKRFDESITEASITTALMSVTITGSAQTYADVTFAGDVSSLIMYTQLIPMSINMKVTVDSRADIITAVQTSWAAVDESISTIEVDIQTQEEFVTSEGAFVNVVLFKATVSGAVMSLEDLPALGVPDLTAVTHVSGEAYQATDVAVGALRRFTMAMSIYVDKWVTREYRSTVLEAVQTTVVAAMGFTEDDMVTIEYGTQEQLVVSGEISFKLSFFVVHADSVINGQSEPELDEAEVQEQFTAYSITEYTVKPSADFTAAINLRMTYSVQVTGQVPQADLATFTTELQTLYTGQFTDVAYTVMATDLGLEVIGEDGSVVTEILYALQAEDVIQDPQIFIGLTHTQLSTMLSVTSSVGVEYTVYVGATFLYENQYQLALAGQVDEATATSLLTTSVAALWAETLEGELELSLTKLEVNFGEAGLRVTKVLYSVSVSGFTTFPANDPEPTVDELQTALASTASVQLFTDDIDSLVRADTIFDIAVEGNVTVGALASGSGAINAIVKSSWVAYFNAAGNQDHEVFFKGSSAVTLTSETSIVVTRLFYGLGASADALTSPVDLPVAPPSEETFVARFNTNSEFDVVTEPVLHVYEKVFTGQVFGTVIDTLTQQLNTAWTTAAAGIEGDVVITVVDTTAQFTALWTKVTKVQYTVQIGSTDASTILDLSEPSDSDLEAVVTDAPPCGCTALNANTVTLAGTVTQQQLTTLQTTVKTKYETSNPDMDADAFVVNVRGLGDARRRRETGDETPVDFTVGVNEQDPDPLFVNVPSDDEINQALEDAGLEPITNPRRCDVTKRFAGAITDTQENREELQTNITMAYVEMNALQSEDDVTVDITNLAMGSDDQNNPIFDVTYCVSRNDGGDLAELVDPSDEMLNKHLPGYDVSDYAGEPGPPVEATTPKAGDDDSDSDKIIIVIAVICGCIALVIVVLALVKVCMRVTRRENEKRNQTHEIRHHDDDDSEDFTGHAPYQSQVFRTSEIDTLKTKLYEARTQTS